MSDTPRTDAMLCECSNNPIDFARQLEHELNTERQSLQSVVEDFRTMKAERDEANTESARLRDIIGRAIAEFFHDGPDGKIAAKMLAVLYERNNVSTKVASEPARMKLSTLQR